MSQRVRCKTCRTAFVTDENQAGGVVECPKCGARHRLPATTREDAGPAPPSCQRHGKRLMKSPRFSSHPTRNGLAGPFAAGLSWSRLWRSSPRRAWLCWFTGRASSPGRPTRWSEWPKIICSALTKNDLEAQHRLSTVEEPPAIRSFQKVARDRTRNQTIKGSFAPLASLHRHIESEFSYDPAIARFTPKHPLGAAAETLDAVHAAKDEAEKTKLYEKMASGDPNDIFDAAENFGKVFSKLAEGALAPKKIIPTYRMLVDDAKPPIPSDQKALACARVRAPQGLGHLAQAPLSHSQSRRPIHLRRGRS